MRRLRNLISLANLMIRERRGADRLGRGGQVATFLLLMIVAALIFVMMTANLGQVSLAATRVANAADSSSLLLGSQLATKSRVLGETLGSKGSPAKQKCTSGGGMLGPILAIIIAIIAIVAQQYELFAFLGTILGATTATGMAMTAGAIGGAVGGAIGGGITGGGQGALVGAIQGAITGASIGYGMGSGAGMGGDFFGTAVAGVADAVFVPSAVGAAVGATAGAALSAGSNLYSGSVMDQMREDAIGAAGKKLSGLPEYDRIRETVVQRALMQTVDDPTKIQDNYQGCPDSDEDGNTTEMVPFFQVWWACRTKGIQAVVPVLTSLTQDFLNGPLATFESAAKAAMTPPAGALSRREFEKDASGTGVDGAVVELARALTNKGFALKFWQPGPDPVALDTWNKTDCETCQPPSGFDEVDFAIDTFHDIVDASSGQGDKPGLKGQPIDRVVNTWQTWLKLFYNPAANERGDFYDVLGVIVNGGNEIKGGADVTGMNAWKTEIETIRKGLPQCTYIYSVCDGSDPLCVPGVPVSVQYPLPCRGDGTVIPASGIARMTGSARNTGAQSAPVRHSATPESEVARPSVSRMTAGLSGVTISIRDP